jgi:hypothetical protein
MHNLSEDGDKVAKDVGLIEGSKLGSLVGADVGNSVDGVKVDGL